MSQTATPTTGPVRAPHETVQGLTWFAFMVAMWSIFFTLLAASVETLEDVWSWLTGLPLVAEIAMWIVLLPWALAYTVWQSSWDEWLRILLVVVIAGFWVTISKSRAKAG